MRLHRPAWGPTLVPTGAPAQALAVGRRKAGQGACRTGDQSCQLEHVWPAPCHLVQGEDVAHSGTDTAGPTCPAVPPWIQLETCREDWRGSRLSLAIRLIPFNCGPRKQVCANGARTEDSPPWRWVGLMVLSPQGPKAGVDLERERRGLERDVRPAEDFLSAPHLSNAQWNSPA